ncbi:hypothetical protein KP509_18G032500 [Ceratopteris richardii]|uniref:Spindle assembly abnormal protein 6 N-terminal domain-containing protein n=1 Tax=Ceratopteris richardii TaxID=49495 RepID=A0A8T2SRR7_CERRI|nr:hypothetical protein KP509_18G032500 [Ceratopteris richardii]KAH7365520.1 hypothetical protein KP509_18G032500 [Ceratopteris richardii]KAH7365521.1 hypothetical protein KP509_18G032500 [Ceratopteris richardii]KAH7365522.1 hypothetical protein KP509_18G032500 [Ceratopteris richardii]
MPMDDIAKLNLMESSSTLFEKAIPVRVSKPPGSEDRLMELTVRIVMGISKLHRSSKLLRMQLTNEMDPFFLYFLEVSEDDFQSLKVEQCILVDFATFPYKFIELLEHCIDAGSHDSPRFQAILHVRTGDSTFSIVEANQFKHLSHLSLCFRQGNDTTIKTYLAGRLAEFKTANTDLHEKLRRTLMSLEMALRDNSNLSSELSELKESNSQAINQLKAEYSLEMAHEKDKAIQDYTDAKEKFEKERAELEVHFRQQTEAQQNRLLELEKQVRCLLDSKHALEVKNAEVSTRLETSEKELEEKVQECERLRVEYHNSENEKQEVTKALNKHLVRLGALDQEVHDKSELISSLQKQLEIQTSQRASLELSFKDAQAASERAEERSKTSDAELVRCRQTIEKLQAELRTCKAKVKLKGQMASQQDNLLLERQTAMERAMQENNSLKQEIATIKDDNEGLKKKIEEMKSKLQESQELQQSNQQMIQWLNQQLTDAQLGRLSTSNVSSRLTLRPSSLSLLTGSDSISRTTSSHLGPSFSASASLNGALSCTAYKSMLRSNSPFGQTTFSKSVGTSANNVSSSVLSTKSTRPVGSSSTSLCTSSALKVYKPLTHLIPKADLLAGGSNSGVKLLSGHDKPESITKLEDSSGSAGKVDDDSWTLLPRPPLSFVEARSELLNLASKNQNNSTSKKIDGLGSGKDVSSIKVAAHADSLSSKPPAKVAS